MTSVIPYTTDTAISAYIELLNIIDRRVPTYNRSPREFAECKKAMLLARQSLDIPSLENVNDDTLSLMSRVLTSDLPSVT